MGQKKYLESRLKASMVLKTILLNIFSLKLFTILMAIINLTSDSIIITEIGHDLNIYKKKMHIISNILGLQ